MSVVPNYGYKCLPRSSYLYSPSHTDGGTSGGVADELPKQRDILHPEGYIGRLKNVGCHQLQVQLPPKLLLLVLLLPWELWEQRWRG